MATAPMPILCQNRVYYPLNWESGVLARTRCHYLLTPLFHHYPYTSLECFSAASEVYNSRPHNSYTYHISPGPELLSGTAHATWPRALPVTPSRGHHALPTFPVASAKRFKSYDVVEGTSLISLKARSRERTRWFGMSASCSPAWCPSSARCPWCGATP